MWGCAVIRGRAGALLLVPMAVAACQAPTATNMPPRATAATTTPPPEPSPRRPHDLVVEAYSAYWPVLVEAGRASPDEARELLRPYVKGGYLDHLVDGVRSMIKQGREPSGAVLPGLKEVRVGGDYAEVIDCQDVSKTAMADRRTHRVIPGTSASRERANIKASLERSDDGNWRLTALSIREDECKPPAR
jgi:guanyl-specific ribonuclease Sa